jgi:chromosome segregation ATPase
MAEQAKVTSIDALESFRSAMIVFLTDARRSLDEVGDAVRRTKQWLENDQRAKWESEIRRRNKILSEAQQELFGSRISNLKTASAQKEEAVRKARRAVAEAEEKLRNVKKWNKNYDSIVEPMIKQLEGLRGYLDHDMIKSLSYLVQAQKTLEGYSEMAPPPESAPPPSDSQPGTPS